jgi:hypothetical protein
MKNTFHGNEKFTINVRKSHRQRQYTSQLVREDRVFLSWSTIFLWGQQHPKCEWAIRLAYPRFFRNIHSSCNPTNQNLMELDLEIQTNLLRINLVLDMCSYKLFSYNDQYYYLQKY